MRALAVRKAKQIQQILHRKEMFEKSWFVLVHFVKRIEAWNNSLDSRRKEIAWEAAQNNAADIIKCYWRKYYPIPVKWRTRRFARSYAIHIRNNLAVYTRVGPRKQFVEYVNQKIKDVKLARHFLYFIAAAQRIQRCWKVFRFNDLKRYAKIVGLWTICYNKAISASVKRSKKKKKGKKRAKEERVDLVTAELKEYLLLSYYKN
jgi:hypothetical protein